VGYGIFIFMFSCSEQQELIKFILLMYRERIGAERSALPLQQIEFEK
jgi:hypothetical protein